MPVILLPCWPGRTAVRLPARLSRCLQLLATVAGLALPAPVPAQNAVLFREGFDTAAVPSLPRGWHTTRNRSPDVDDFQVASGTARSTPNAALSTNATVAQELTTPSIALGGFSRLALSFALRRSSTYAAVMVVELSTDGGERFPLSMGDSIRPANVAGYQEVLCTTTLQSPPPDSCRIRWRVIPAQSGSAGTLRIDDIVLAASADRDLSLASLAVFPPVPAESSMLSVRITVVNSGTEPLGAGRVVLSWDRDRDSISDADELIAAAPLPYPIGSGDTLNEAIELQAPTAGEYLLLGEIQCPPDQIAANNFRRLSIRVAEGWNRLVINEVQYTPAGDEPEWVEVLNLRATDRAVGGWSLYDSRTAPIAPGLPATCRIRGGDVIILTGDSLACVAAHPVAAEKIWSVQAFPSLNNAGDHLYLRDPWGTIVDSLWYQPSWGGNAGGISMERIDGSAPSQDPSNWGSCSRRDGSTPGEMNSIAVRDTDIAIAAVAVDPAGPLPATGVILRLRNAGKTPIREIEMRVWFTDPLPPVPADSAILENWSGELLPGDSLVAPVHCGRSLQGILGVAAMCRTAGDRHQANDTLSTVVRFGFPDRTLVVNEIMPVPVASGTEYVEILNPGPTVVDMRQWTLSQGSGSGETSYQLAPEGSVIQGGGFYVLASDSSLFRLHVIPQDVANSGIRILGSPSLGLNNEGDLIILRDPSGRVIDSVEYRSTWHRPEIPDRTGRSLERIHPLLPSDDSQTWSSSVDWTGGTPGRQNSIALASAALAGSLTCSPSTFSPDGDGRDDFTVIRYESPHAAGTISVRIFDARGRLVRWLAGRELSSAHGTVVWDGRDEYRRFVRIGIYVILAEVVGGGGGEWNAKAVVVVAGKL